MFKDKMKGATLGEAKPSNLQLFSVLVPVTFPDGSTRIVKLVTM